MSVFFKEKSTDAIGQKNHGEKAFSAGQCDEFHACQEAGWIAKASADLLRRFVERYPGGLLVRGTVHELDSQTQRLEIVKQRCIEFLGKEECVAYAFHGAKHGEQQNGTTLLVHEESDSSSQVGQMKNEPFLVMQLVDMREPAWRERQSKRLEEAIRVGRACFSGAQRRQGFLSSADLSLRQFLETLRFYLHSTIQ